MPTDTNPRTDDPSGDADIQFKMVPKPPSSRRLARLRDAWQALPIVPADEDDCCERLIRRVGFPSRDVSRTWLTFLRALGVVERTASGFTRIGTEPTAERLRDGFLDRILLARETLRVVARRDTDHETRSGPTTVETAFERLRSDVPTYERYKNPDSWESIWRERTEYVLEWLVALALLERIDTDADRTAGDDEPGYVVTDRGRDRLRRT